MICDGEFSRPTQRLPSFKQKTIVNRDDQESPRGSGNIFLYCFRYIVFRMSLFFSSRYLFGGESYIFLLNATDICGYFCLNYYFLTLSNHHMCCLYFQLFFLRTEYRVYFSLLRTAVPVFFVCLIGSRRVIYFS